MIKIAKMQALWESNITDFLTQSNDSVTIYYKPLRTSTGVGFDKYFQESTDSVTPKDIGDITETTPTAVIVNKGKTHLDLYGASVSGSEDIDKISSAGSFDQYDALFTCLLSDVDLGSGKTSFSESDYIIVDKDSGKYKVTSEKKRGMNGAFLLDIFLEKTNK